jgi:uncharacterized iron-regulated membrane protein
MRQAAGSNIPATSGFHASMNWLHTWGGVVIGALLFAIFWMGSLSVFDREFDRWMMPMTRLATTEATSLDALKPIVATLVAEPDRWSVFLPSERVPTVQLEVHDAGRGIVETRHVNPANATLLADSGTLGGTGFFFPFHFKLHFEFLDLGYWLVGIAGMMMMLLCISGVVIHTKILADFFTLRLVRKPQRTTLDLHNVFGVFGLPFNFMISLSGLVISMSIYMPTPQQIAYNSATIAQGRQAFVGEGLGRFERAPAGRPSGLASLDAMQAEAMRRWGGERPYFVRVLHPGDTAGYVEMRRRNDRGVTLLVHTIYFDASTGRVLRDFRADNPVMTANRFISGMHFIRFHHWTLRWLYFFSGLAGCALIATGLIFWVQSRRKRHAKLGLRGVAVVEGLTIGATTGIMVATLAFLIINRLLPLEAEHRQDIEVWTFYAVWVGTFSHAWMRRTSAWGEQAWCIAAGALAAALLNAVTTGDTIWIASAKGQWAVAGVDSVLVAAAGAATMIALKIRRRQATGPAPPQIPSPAP